MYAEDIDLSYRVLKAGYKNFYLGNVTILHFKGESTKKGSLNYVRVFYQAMRLFVRKYYSGTGAWFVSKGLYAGILFRQLIAALALPYYKKRDKNNTVVFQKIYLVGNAVQIEMAIKIIKKSHPNTVIQLVNEVGEIESNIRENVLVLCIGNSLTYKEAIQLSQRFYKTSLWMWSGKGSHSIVGSNSKNTSGYVWY